MPADRHLGPQTFVEYLDELVCTSSWAATM